MRSWMFCAIWLALATAASYGQVTGYELLANWLDLPRAKTGLSAGLASSYDRTAVDEDSNQYLQPQGFQTEDAQTVIAEIPGPGIITRFWMPHLTANQGFTVRLAIDGQPLIDTRSNVLLAGQYAHFKPPLVQTLLGGQVSYEPIVFERSLRIESNNLKVTDQRARRHFYQYSYLRLPTGESVVSYSGDLTPTQQKARAAVTAMLRNLGSNPAGTSRTAVSLPIQGRTIPPKTICPLAGIKAGGTVRCINLKMPVRATDLDLDSLRLRVRYDGRKTNAIDVPVAHFFGAGHGRVPYKSLPLGTDSPEGYYCYWPMPFRENLVVELLNAGKSPVTFESARIEYEPGLPPADASYLHAAYSQERTRPDQEHHVLLDVRGAGHYVGNLLYIARMAGQPGLLEGDDIITVNPGTPSEAILHGTGLEDAYNGGFYYNHEQVLHDILDMANPSSGIAPYHGLLYMDYSNTPTQPPRVHATQYRWMIGDLVPFTDGITVKVENYTREASVVFGSTAFYYQTDSAAVTPSAASRPATSRPAR